MNTPEPNDMNADSINDDRPDPERQTLDALDALEKEAPVVDDGQEFGDDAPLDELELLIQAYLDDELAPEERDAFETRMKNEPALRARVDEERNAVDLIGADDLEKDDVPANPAILENTVVRLNAETQARIDEVASRNKKLTRRNALIQFGAPILFLILGFSVFAAFTPNIERQRERDAAVVERLAQFEAVGDFEYLQALAQANLFEKWKESLPKEFFQNGQKNVVAPDVRELPYDKLIQNTVFYRLQRRFEALDRETQNKYRELRRQIDESPDRAKLLTTLDDYSSWLASSTIPSDRKRFETLPIPVRVQEIRRRVDGAQQFADLMRSRPNEPRPGEPAGPGAPGRPKDDGPTSSLRATLPESLQTENFKSIYEKYVQFRDQKLDSSEESRNRHDDVLEFLANTKQEDLVSDFSQESKDELDALDPEQRSSLMGLIVSLSFLENANAFVTTRPFQKEDGPRNAVLQPRSGSIQELAKTLRNASPEQRDFVTSRPPLEARGFLMGLNWGFLGPDPNNRNGFGPGFGGPGGPGGPGFGPGGPENQRPGGPEPPDRPGFGGPGMGDFDPGTPKPDDKSTEKTDSDAK